MRLLFGRGKENKRTFLDNQNSSIHSFLVSAAHILKVDFFPYLVSGYEIVRFDEINDLVESSHSMAARSLGVTSLFKYKVSRFGGSLDLSIVVFNYISDEGKPNKDRFWFTECLISKIFERHKDHYFRIHDLLELQFKTSGLPYVIRDGRFAATIGELHHERVSDPFWTLLAGDEWRNVREDMQHALNASSAGGKDPAFYAGRALESTIKIVCEKTGRTSGKENGASAFVDSLLRKKDQRFIEPWEGEFLKIFFSSIRNKTAHGAGKNEILSFSSPQERWILDFCMIWVTSLVSRMK